MRKIQFIVLVTVLLTPLISFHAEAQELDKKDLEEVLLMQFHKQISASIKKEYGFNIVQYEKPQVISIKKEYVPEASEEMKPVSVYEVTLKVEVLNVSPDQNELTIILSNSNLDGEFAVKRIKKS